MRSQHLQSLFLRPPGHRAKPQAAAHWPGGCLARGCGARVEMANSNPIFILVAPWRVRSAASGGRSPPGAGAAAHVPCRLGQRPLQLRQEQDGLAVRLRSGRLSPSVVSARRCSTLCCLAAVCLKRGCPQHSTASGSSHHPPVYLRTTCPCPPYPFISGGKHRISRLANGPLRFVQPSKPPQSDPEARTWLRKMLDSAP